MARIINTRPRIYYGYCAAYCRRRIVLSTNDTAKWFWMAASMRYEHLIAGDAARVLRFKDKPWRFPKFKYH